MKKPIVIRNRFRIKVIENQQEMNKILMIK